MSDAKHPSGIKGRDAEELDELARRIQRLDTRRMTARNIADRLEVPLYVTYAALLRAGRTTDAGDYYLPAVGTGPEQPLYERIAQIDTSDMTIEEIADHFDVTTNRVRSALNMLGRFAKNGGYKVKPREKPAATHR